MRSAGHTPTPFADRAAGLISSGAVTERVASGSHAFAYEGVPTLPVGSTIDEYRARRRRPGPKGMLAWVLRAWAAS
jgi:hypothetical protein